MQAAFFVGISLAAFVAKVAVENLNAYLCLENFSSGP